VKRFLYRSFTQLRGDRLMWKLSSNRLRILCYHGVCQDRLRQESWVPGYFVTESSFEQQLRYLREHATVLPLDEAVARLKDGSLPARAVSLTFDDGYANNMHLAYRLLKAYRMHATIFLSSAYVESGELYPFLKLQLIKRSGRATGRAPVYKSEPLDTVNEWIGKWWPAIEPTLSDDQRQTLRPSTIDEVRAADPELIAFGAHTHTHCILENETLERRQKEIISSVDKVSQWTDRPAPLFSYPNGQREDFGEVDKQALRAKGIIAAVSGILGSNTSGDDPLELKRYPVGIYHDASAFPAEVTGFRTAVLTAGGGLAS
jgi:peptidoglycan/xylan/chitin deacetylase (PgdA/CDA1 family)